MNFKAVYVITPFERNCTSKNIIQTICTFLKDLNPLWQISKYYSLIVGQIYFSNKELNASLIDKNNKHLFRSFVHKYKFPINVNNIKNNSQLIFFNTFNIKSVSFDYCYNTFYIKYFLTFTIKKIKLPNILNFKIKKLSQLSTLTIYNDNFDEQCFPSSLKTLCLGVEFDKPINVLPPILELEFGYWFNCKISNFPSTLKKIKFGYTFNQPITLPKNLEELIFGEEFNQPIILPENLKKLIFGEEFNQPIILPNGLKILEFGHYFNQQILLPNTLKKLKFGYFFNQYNNLSELSELKELCINFNKLNILPFTLQKLTLLSNLAITSNGNDILSNNLINKLSSFNNLKTLKLPNLFNKEIKSLPESLTSLHFCGKFNNKFNMPSNLEKLYLDCDFDQNIESLPLTLKILKLGNKFDKSMKKILTHESLEYLTFHFSYVFSVEVQYTVLSKSFKKISIVHYNKIDFKKIFKKYSVKIINKTDSTSIIFM